MLGFVSAVGGLIRQRVGHHGGFSGGIRREANGHAAQAQQTTILLGYFKKTRKKAGSRKPRLTIILKQQGKRNGESQDRLESLTVELEGRHDGK